MKRWGAKKLGEIATVQMGQSPPGETYNSDGVGLPFFQGKAEFGKEYPMRVKWCSQPSRIAEAGDILLSVRAPVGPTNFATERCCIGRGLAAIRGEPKECNQRYIRYYLKRFESDIAARGVGSTFTAINRNDIERLELPVPPLAEQERIVKLLDEADELRKLRAQADRRTADLIPSLFYKMFGDTAENPKGLPVFPFGELLAEPLRNGLSPAKDGSNPAKVFTLSAITGEEFDGSAWKEASFARLPDKNCQVTEHLFLICRGNGNREFVGCGKFPLHLTMNTVFPDTMIAAVPKLDRILPAFLEAAWKQPTTRSQIQSNARTTNGTFKINQTSIEQIRLPVPPLPLQNEFAARVSEIRAMQAEQGASLRGLDDLFHSMLHRAFRGEL